MKSIPREVGCIGLTGSIKAVPREVGCIGITGSIKAAASIAEPREAGITVSHGPTGIAKVRPTPAKPLSLSRSRRSFRSQIKHSIGGVISREARSRHLRVLAAAADAESAVPKLYKYVHFQLIEARQRSDTWKRSLRAPPAV